MAFISTLKYQHYRGDLELVKTGFMKPRGIAHVLKAIDPYVRTTLKLFDAETYKQSRGWTRSGGDTKSLQQQVASYDREYKKFEDIPHKYRRVLLKAIDHVREEFRLSEKVIPKWYYDVEIDPSTSSGYPHYVKKGKLGKLLFDEARILAHRMKYYGVNTAYPPCTMAMAGKISPDTDPKTRLIWQYPGAMTVIEGVFAQPLIDAYLQGEKSHLFLTGKGATARHMQFMSRTGRGSTFYGLDFSQYDASIPPFLIRAAFSILADNILFGAYADADKVLYGGEGTEKRAKKLWEHIIYYFIYTLIVDQQGNLRRKHGGVPSGSYFTNLLESIMTRIIYTFVFMLFGIYHLITMFCTNGDDSAILLSSDARIPLEDLIIIVQEVFGIVIKSEKCIVTQNADETYVSGSVWKGGMPYRNTDEWFRLALAPRSYVLDANMSFSRLCGLYIAGAFRDEKFCLFMEFFQTCYPLKQPDYDPHDWKMKMLGWTKDEFQKLNKLTVFLHYC